MAGLNRASQILLPIHKYSPRQVTKPVARSASQSRYYTQRITPEVYF